MPCRAAVAVPPVAARSAWARARPHASLPRVASRLVRTRAAESDGGSPDDDDASASSTESLFTPEFSAAFRAAQERLDAKEAASPERSRINDEVAQIMARVEAERELEAALPVEDDEDERSEEAKNEKLQEVEEQFGEKLDNPLFTPEFKRAFIEAQERIAERNAPMMAKINDEVADIMAQVQAEREAAERGERVDTSRPLRAGGRDLGDLGDLGAPIRIPGLVLQRDRKVQKLHIVLNTTAHLIKRQALVPRPRLVQGAQPLEGNFSQPCNVSLVHFARCGLIF